MGRRGAAARAVRSWQVGRRTAAGNAARPDAVTTIGGAGAGAAAPQRPMVSVVIPAFNAAEHLGDALDSVLAQTGAFELDVIVVDDGSTDDTPRVAQVHAGVRFLRLDANQGPSAARNAGIAAARGQLVGFLDADDLWSPGSLAARVATLHRHPYATLVFGDCRQFDERGPHERTLFEAAALGEAAWGQGGIVADAYECLLDDNFITTGSVVVRRADLAAAGGFAEDLRLVEDLDLWLRLARHRPIAWCPQVCLLRRRHAANLSRDPDAMSLAYLEVLRRQAEEGGTAASSRRLAALAAREQLLLAERALQQAKAGEALHWAWRSALNQPRLRALWRTAQAALLRLIARHGTARERQSPHP